MSDSYYKTHSSYQSRSHHRHSSHRTSSKRSYDSPHKSHKDKKRHSKYKDRRFRSRSRSRSNSSTSSSDRHKYRNKREVKTLFEYNYDEKAINSSLLRKTLHSKYKDHNQDELLNLQKSHSEDGIARSSTSDGSNLNLADLTKVTKYNSIPQHNSIPLSDSPSVEEGELPIYMRKDPREIYINKNPEVYKLPEINLGNKSNSEPATPSSNSLSQIISHGMGSGFLNGFATHVLPNYGQQPVLQRDPNNIVEEEKSDQKQPLKVADLGLLQQPNSTISSLCNERNANKIDEEDPPIILTPSKLTNASTNAPEDYEGDIVFEEVKDEPPKAESKLFKPLKIPLSSTKKYLPDPRLKILDQLKSREKLNLILDLDETMLNSVAGADKSKITNLPAEAIIEYSIPVPPYKSFVILRPYARKFLEQVSKYYNIIVYSHGVYDYVLKMLEFLDKDAKYINREIIFKNIGQVKSNTPKQMINLNLPPEEIQKSLIIDDQRVIWIDDHKKVIPSKRFIPLKELMDEKKYSEYLVHRGALDTVLFHSSKELEYYAETSLQSKYAHQLEILATFLIEIADSYNTYNLRKLHDSTIRPPPVEEIYAEKMKGILKDTKVAIIADHPRRAQMFGSLATSMGAEVVDDERKASIILVDIVINMMQRRQLELIMQEQSLMKILNVYWLIETFFNLKKVPEKDYVWGSR